MKTVSNNNSQNDFVSEGIRVFHQGLVLEIDNTQYLRSRALLSVRVLLFVVVAASLLRLVIESVSNALTHQSSSRHLWSSFWQVVPMQVLMVSAVLWLWTFRQGPGRLTFNASSDTFQKGTVQTRSLRELKSVQVLDRKISRMGPGYDLVLRFRPLARPSLRVELWAAFDDFFRVPHIAHFAHQENAVQVAQTIADYVGVPLEVK